MPETRQYVTVTREGAGGLLVSFLTTPFWKRTISRGKVTQIEGGEPKEGFCAPSGNIVFGEERFFVFNIVVRKSQLS